MFSTIRPRSAFRLDGEDLRHETADEVEDQHDEDQHKGCGPGAFHRDGGDAGRGSVGRAVRVELGILLVDVHRKRGHLAGEEVDVRGGDVACGHQQRSGFTDHAGDGENRTRNDARQGGAQHDLRDRALLRDAQGVRGLAQIVRHDLEHFLGRLDHGRQHQQGKCDGAFETVDGAGADQNREHREGEQACDDGRDAAHHVDQQGDDLCQLATVGIFHQVHGAHQADRDGDEHGAEGDFQRADDGVQDAAVAAGRGRVAADHAGHVVAQEVEVQPLDAVDDGGEQHREQRDQRHDERARDERLHGEVLALAR